MKNLLAIDNSDQCSLALLTADGNIRHQNAPSFGRDCDSRFLPCLEAFLAESRLTIRDVDGWTIGTGPGSFAGIRFILGMVKGICTVTHANCRGIPASYALCRALNQKGSVAILQDARCGKLFYSPFLCEDNLHCRQTAASCLIDADPAVLANLPESFLATPSAEVYQNLPQDCQEKITLLPPPEARYLLDAPEELFPWLTTPEIEPLYVRPPA